MNSKNEQLLGENELVKEEIDRKEKFNTKLKQAVNFIRDEELIMNERNELEKNKLVKMKMNLKKSISKGLK